MAVLAVLVLSGEYGTGMIRVTFAARPQRITVLAAKAAVVTGLVLAAGSLAVLGSVLAGRLILPGHGFTAARGFPPLSLADGPVARAAAGSVLYLALIALLSLGVAAIVRDAAAAIGLVLGLLYLFPVVAQVLGPQWYRHMEQIGPMSAGLAIQATTGLRSLPISPWAGLGVLAAWAAAALLAGGLMLGRLRRGRAGPGRRAGGRRPGPGYSVLLNSAMATPSMPRPMTATRASDSQTGTGQPSQVMLGDSWEANSGLRLRCENTACRIGPTT